GLPAVKQRSQTTNPPDAPQNLRLRHGQMPGTVDGVVDPIPGGNIRSYEGQSTLDANAGPWSETVVFPNSRAIHFDGLPRGKDTWFRVRARNVIGAGPWSDPATIMVT
ncbi:MAG: fibronectin type III domain-containing protein, partial [Verrucomicrobiota bacterium]|nr:fibronectin type III domain-containing protein [Verrucomicrobiota bacterium]